MARKRWAIMLLVLPEPGWPSGEILMPGRRAWTFAGAIAARRDYLDEHPGVPLDEVLVGRLDRHGFALATWTVDADGIAHEREERSDGR